MGRQSFVAGPSLDKRNPSGGRSRVTASFQACAHRNFTRSRSETTERQTSVIVGVIKLEARIKLRGDRRMLFRESLEYEASLVQTVLVYSDQQATQR